MNLKTDIPIISLKAEKMQVRIGYIVVKLIPKSDIDQETGLRLTTVRGNQEVGIVFISYPGAFAQVGEVVLLPSSSTQRFKDDEGAEYAHICEEDSIVKWQQ